MGGEKISNRPQGSDEKTTVDSADVAGGGDDTTGGGCSLSFVVSLSLCCFGF